MALRLKTGINPIDLNKNKAIGVAFPYDTPGVFSQSFSERDAVKRNLFNLIILIYYFLKLN